MQYKVPPPPSFQAEHAEEEEEKELLAEESATQQQAEADQLSVLDALTGCPLPEDDLLYAIPVCAPYSAILSYK